MKGVHIMATSSITKNFIVAGAEQVERFVDAIEASVNNPAPRRQTSADFLTDKEEIREFMKKRKKTDGEK